MRLFIRTSYTWQRCDSAMRRGLLTRRRLPGARKLGFSTELKDATRWLIRGQQHCENYVVAIFGEDHVTARGNVRSAAEPRAARHEKDCIARRSRRTAMQDHYREVDRATFFAGAVLGTLRIRHSALSSWDKVPVHVVFSKCGSGETADPPCTPAAVEHTNMHATSHDRDRGTAT